METLIDDILNLFTVAGEAKPLYELGQGATGKEFAQTLTEIAGAVILAGLLI
jgi:hypothetical protein